MKIQGEGGLGKIVAARISIAKQEKEREGEKEECERVASLMAASDGAASSHGAAGAASSAIKLAAPSELKAAQSSAAAAASWGSHKGHGCGRFLPPSLPSRSLLPLPLDSFFSPSSTLSPPFSSFSSSSLLAPFAFLSSSLILPLFCSFIPSLPFPPLPSFLLLTPSFCQCVLLPPSTPSLLFRNLRIQDLGLERKKGKEGAREQEGEGRRRREGESV